MTTKELFLYRLSEQADVSLNKVWDFLSLQGLVTHERPASMQAQVHLSPAGFPLVNQDQNFQKNIHVIQGSALSVQLTDVQQKILDELAGFNPLNLKGSLHHRSLIQVESQGKHFEADAFLVNLSRFPKSKLLEDGICWKSSLEKAVQFKSSLTEKQKQFLKKLGQINSRDTLPIDLPLYRELMGLNLIVDKGRRLALSPLGQDVYWRLE